MNSMMCAKYYTIMCFYIFFDTISDVYDDVSLQLEILFSFGSGGGFGGGGSTFGGGGG